jgi:hypothetical protein
MVTTLRRMALVLGAAALAACSSPLDADPQPEGVRFTVDRDAYAPGDTVSARLVNGSEVALGYNLCFSTLERQAGAGWTVADEPLMVCTAELRSLQPGESVGHRRVLPDGLERGRYRLRTHVEHPLPRGSRVEVRSETFTVGR